MGDRFWKAKERRILGRWFNTTRIGSTGRSGPDGRTASEVIEIFTYPIPKKLEQEFSQAENDCVDGQIPWAVFGPKGGRDEDMILFSKLKYFPAIRQWLSQLNSIGEKQNGFTKDKGSLLPDSNL